MSLKCPHLSVLLLSCPGCYRGQYKNGVRSGFGTRTSAAYEHRNKDGSNLGGGGGGGTPKQRHISSLIAPLASSLKRTSFSMPSSASTSALPTTSSTTTTLGREDPSSGQATAETAAAERSSNMQIYEGEWRDDKRHGYGVIKCIGLYTYYGQWASNARTGYGVLVGENGAKEEGQWQNGELIVALKRKKLHLKSHQLEAKVQTAHTQAIQAADTARNKALLAESRAATATGKAKTALSVIATAERNQQLAREKAEQYKNATRISGTRSIYIHM